MLKYHLTSSYLFAENWKLRQSINQSVRQNTPCHVIGGLYIPFSEIKFTRWLVSVTVQTAFNLGFTFISRIEYNTSLLFLRVWCHFLKTLSRRNLIKQKRIFKWNAPPTTKKKNATIATATKCKSMMNYGENLLHRWQRI